MIDATVILQRFYARLKLRHLQALIALDDFGTMGKAAQALGITQPAMSYLIAEIEKLIEVQLFLRNARGVSPTDTALELIPIARRIRAVAEEGAERIALQQRKESGLVRVAATAAATGAMLDSMVTTFAETHPQVQVHIKTVVADTQDAAFASGDFDIVCGRSRGIVPESWAFVPCKADAMVPVCSPGHALAAKSTVTLDDLENVTWMTNHVSTVARRMFEDLVAQAGWKDLKQVRIVSQIGQLTWAMLRDGKYISLIPRSVAMPWLRSGELIELSTGLNLALDPIGFYYRPDATASATRKFAAELSRGRDKSFV